MPFMLRISVQILPLAALMPQLWGALALLAISAVIASRRRARADIAPWRAAPFRWTLEMGLLLIVPLLILGWGVYFWPASGRSPQEAWALRGLALFGVVQVVVALWLMWRHRARLWSTVAVAALTLWWCAGAFFTASMAITNTWL